MESGARIGKYRITARLGRGGMGEVWRAHDERLHRDVALKVLPPELANEPDRRARMLREARAAAAIRHVNVVTLYDIVEHEGGDILVMELVEGRTLHDLLRDDGPPSLELALRWVEAIAGALAAAHARDILHRDVKSANVMIASDGAVKVLDFGLAKLVTSELLTADTTVREQPVGSLDATIPAATDDHNQTRAGSILGTPFYIAPEQVAGEAASVCTDVYSVGVLAYEILSGQLPYRGPTLAALFVQISELAAAPLAGVPESVADIVRRAMDKDPAKRFSTMQALRDAIAAERARRFAPAARRWPLAIAGAMILAAGVIGVYAWRATRAGAHSPGDMYVERALEEFNGFYRDKARASLRAALRVSPNHPRANAYMILFGAAPADDRYAALIAAQRARPQTAEKSKDRALLDAAIAYEQRGPAAAREALIASAGLGDEELAFWAAELAYDAADYHTALDGYRALVEDRALPFRGRVYDHESAVLIYFDEPDEALRIGTLYRDAFPGEADAVEVYALTLAAAGRLDEALAAGQDALHLHETEDTLAGLAKVCALRGDHARAKQLYQRALDAAAPHRRPLRRAALGLLQWIDGELDAAKATVAPCVDVDHSAPADSEAHYQERGTCLFVAGIIDASQSDAIAKQLEELAAEAPPTRPDISGASALARLVHARERFFGGGCVVDPRRSDVATATGDVSSGDYDVTMGLPIAYHVPFLFAWATCEQAALLAARGDRASATAKLRPIATRAPQRGWLLATLARYE